MNKDAVQHERGPRNSTLRRQMAMFIGKDMMNADEVKKIQQDLIFRALPMQPTIPSYILDLSSSRNQTIIDSTAYHRAPVLPASFNPVVPLSPTNPIEHIFETTAELLFANIRWMKAQCMINPMPMGDQLILLKYSWTDLFILGAAQFLWQFNFSPLILSCHQSTEKRAIVHSEGTQFQSILYKLADMNIDSREYSCMRSIALYNAAARIDATASDDDDKVDPATVPATGTRLEESAKITAYRDEAIANLAAHINVTKPIQPLRLENLMLMLDQLKRVSSYTIEELFFRRTIGEVTMVKVMVDMYSQGKIV